MWREALARWGIWPATFTEPIRDSPALPDDDCRQDPSVTAARQRVLAEQVDRLAGRLEDGWRKIEAAEVAGDDETAERYEAVWLRLLADYERAYDKLAGRVR